MSDRELQIKIALAKDGLAQDAAGAAALIKDQLGNIELDLPVNDSGVKLAEQAINQLAQETEAAAQGAQQLQDAYDLNPEKAAALTTEVQRLNDEATRGDASAEMGRIAQEAGRAEEQLAGVNRGFGSIAVAAGGVGAAIGGLFAKGIQQAADYERTFLTLERQIESTGGSVGLTAQELQKFANDLGNATLTSEEAVLRASRSLLSFRSVTGDTFTRAITVAQDLAEVMGGDLEGNIVQIGKALEDPVKGLNALSRSGTNFTEQQQELIKSLVESGDAAAAQQVILEELERQYGGAGLAAAQGLTGALDTLGEETNDLIRTFGAFASEAAVPVVNAAIALLATFNNLPAPIKQVLVATTAFTGVLATAVATLAAYNFASGQKIVQDALAAVSTAKKTLAMVADTTATTVATVAHTVYALAVGKATAAQVAMTASALKLGLALGVAAGAVASVALVAETFGRVTGPAREIDEAARGVDEALRKIAESGQSATESIANLGSGQAQQNLAELEQSIGGVQRALDVFRGGLSGIPEAIGEAVDDSASELSRLVGVNEEVGNKIVSVAKNVVNAVVPGAALIGGVISNISTSVDAATNRSIVAFNNLIGSTDDVRLAAAQLAVDLENGVSIPPETIAATVAGIDESIRALQAQKPVKEEDIARTKAQIEALEGYRDRIAETTEGTVALGDATGGLTDALKDMGEALQLSLGAINLTKLQAEAKVIEDLNRGIISQAEADAQLANVGRLALEDQLKAQRDALNNLKELRAKAADGSKEALDLDKQILQAETAIAQARRGLAQGVADSARDAEKARAKAAEDAAKAQEKTLKEQEKAAAEQKRIDRERAKAAADAAKAAEEANRERLRQIEAEKKAQITLAQVELDVAASRIKSIDRVGEALRRQQQLLTAQAQLTQAIFALESSINEAKRGQLQRIIEDEEASQQQKQKAAQDLIRLTEEQFAREKTQLEQSQALELQAFDLEQQRAAIGEQREIKQQELALKRLELQRLEIQNEIELARLRGDDRAVQIGEAQLGLLAEQSAAQQDYILSLRQQAAVTEELGTAQRNALLIQQEQQDLALAAQQRQTAAGVNEQVSGVSGRLDQRGNRLEDAALRRELQQQRAAAAALPRLGTGINEQVAAMASVSTAGMGAMLNPQALAQPIVEELQTLGGAINALAASPRQLTVQTPDPVADTSRILGDLTRMQTAGVNP